MSYDKIVQFSKRDDFMSEKIADHKNSIRVDDYTTAYYCLHCGKVLLKEF
jgi:hypothetical protein